MSEYVSIKEEVLSTLKAHFPEIREWFGIETLGVFGSVSRGEDTTESDVDILTGFIRIASPTRLFLIYPSILRTFSDAALISSLWMICGVRFGNMLKRI